MHPRQLLLEVLRHRARQLLRQHLRPLLRLPLLLRQLHLHPLVVVRFCQSLQRLQPLRPRLRQSVQRPFP